MTSRPKPLTPVLTGRQIIGCALSAVLCVGALSFSRAGILAWVGLVPYLNAIARQPRRTRLLCSALFGWLFFCGLVYWIGYVSVPGLLVLATYLALYPVLFGLFARRVDRFRDLIFLPLAWVSLEVLRSYALSGFGWGLLGYSQAEYLLIIQCADRVGIWGLSLLVVLVNAAIAQALSPHTRPSRRFTGAAVASWLVLFTLAYGHWCLRQPYPLPQLRLSVVQPNIPQPLKWDPGQKPFIISQLQKLTLQAARQKPDIIIWPETSVPGYLLDEPLLAIWVSRLARQADSYLLAGSARLDQKTRRYYNSALLFDRRGELVSYYDKIHLVPFGEYIPLTPLFWFLRHIPIADFSAGTDFTLLPVTTPAGTALDCAVLICFEDIFPGLVRAFRRAGADIFVTITNEAWFERSTEPFQHLAMGIVRAIENRRWFVRSANTGISCVIDPWGRIRAQVHENGTGLFVAGTTTAVIGGQ